MHRSPIELVDSARSRLDPWLPFEKHSVELETKLRLAEPEPLAPRFNAGRAA